MDPSILPGACHHPARCFALEADGDAVYLQRMDSAKFDFSDDLVAISMHVMCSIRWSQGDGDVLGGAHCVDPKSKSI